jgi:hypothetical protein
MQLISYKDLQGYVGSIIGPCFPLMPTLLGGNSQMLFVEFIFHWV